MEHSFNIETAKEYGILEAILLKNIYFWIKHNEVNEKNFHDGEYWTFNSVRAFSELFPYASERKIRNALKHLEEAGIIRTGNYNKSSYDRTTWYSLTELGKLICKRGKAHLTKTQKGSSKNVEPIPYINTDINTDNKTQIKDTKVSLEGKPQYGNSDINEMMEKWEEMFGFKPKNTKADRFAVATMLRSKSKGKDWIIKTMTLLKEAQKDRYAGKAINGISGFKELSYNYDKVWKWGSNKYQQQEATGGLMKL